MFKLDFQLDRVARLALPYRFDPPSHFRQRLFYAAVSRNIPGKLRRPELLVRFWTGCARASGMAMPKTAVDKKDRSKSRKDKIRTPRQVSFMQTEAQAEGVRGLADSLFRLSIARAYL